MTYEKVTNNWKFRGMNNSQVKLTDKSVLEIRASDKTRKQLAEEYGVAVGTITEIINRRRWKHI